MCCYSELSEVKEHDKKVTIESQQAQEDVSVFDEHSVSVIAVCRQD